MPNWAPGLTYTKDPDAVIDYPFDWSDWLETGDTIQTVTVTVSSGLTKDSVTFTTSAVIVWVSGGTAGSVYTIACRIVTAGGRTDERTIRVLVREQ